MDNVRSLVIRARCIAPFLGLAGAVLIALASGVASAKVTGGSILVPSLEVRETPARDSAIVMTLRQGMQVLLSKVPPAPAGWLHIMYEDESAELRHGYVPIGTVGILTLRSSTDAFAAASDGASFPEVKVEAELGTLKCKRLRRSGGRMESCVVRYSARLAAPTGFKGNVLATCTSALDFVASDGSRATSSEREQLELTSTQARGVAGSVEVAAPGYGAYDQVVFAGLECRPEKVATF
jgi:hypothetical protein